MTFELVATGHPRRSAAESFVRTVYAQRYGAVIRGFPENLAALTDANSNPTCVAGVRFGLIECFSEQYLDLPIELALRASTGMVANRSQILEVTTLASVQRFGSFRLINEVIGVGREMGMRWGVFTATRRLRTALKRVSVDLVELAPARRDRIAAADDWGRYYETDPWVCAVVDRQRAAAQLAETPDRPAVAACG